MNVTRYESILCCPQWLCFCLLFLIVFLRLANHWSDQLPRFGYISPVFTHALTSHRRYWKCVYRPSERFPPASSTTFLFHPVLQPPSQLRVDVALCEMNLENHGFLRRDVQVWSALQTKRSPRFGSERFLVSTPQQHYQHKRYHVG